MRKSRLERVIRWERAKCEIEHLKTAQMVDALQNITVALADQRNETRAIEKAVIARPDLDGAGLSAFAAWRLGATAKERELESARLRCEARLQEQREILLKAKTRCRLLEDLQARRVAELHYEAGRMYENAATEAFLARWNR
jgi:hypothetical protein